MLKNFRLLIIINTFVICNLLFVIFYRDVSACSSCCQCYDGIEVNFGGCPGRPIFIINDTKPGDHFERKVTVKNLGKSKKNIFVYGKRTGGIGPAPLLESALNLQISRNTIVKWAGLLERFFQPGKHDYFLDTINPGQKLTYIFTVDFPFTAGNEYQLKSVIFNIIIRAEDTTHHFNQTTNHFNQTIFAQPVRWNNFNALMKFLLNR